MRFVTVSHFAITAAVFLLLAKGNAESLEISKLSAFPFWRPRADSNCRPSA